MQVKTKSMRAENSRINDSLEKVNVTTTNMWHNLIEGGQINKKCPK